MHTSVVVVLLFAVPPCQLWLPSKVIGNMLRFGFFFSPLLRFQRLRSYLKPSCIPRTVQTYRTKVDHATTKSQVKWQKVKQRMPTEGVQLETFTVKQKENCQLSVSSWQLQKIKKFYSALRVVEYAHNSFMCQPIERSSLAMKPFAILSFATSASLSTCLSMF